MERRFLTLDDVLEVVVYLLSTARNVVGGRGEHASPLFLDCAVRLLSTVLDQELNDAPPILDEIRKEIEAGRDLLSVEAGAYVESIDDLIRIIARDMLERNREKANGG
jgi:hypothetical protein